MGTKNTPNKLTRALTLVVSGVLLITAGILAGAVLTRQPITAPSPAPAAAPVEAEPEYITLPSPSSRPVEAVMPEASPVNLELQSVAPNCHMIWTTHYTLCGHSRQDTEAERSFIGMNEEEVRAAAAGWKLDSFSRTELLLSRTAEMYCPEHLLLKNSEAGLGVYKTDPETLALQEIMKFELDLEHLDDETKLLLGQGMPFADLEEIEGFIENLES